MAAAICQRCGTRQLVDAQEIRVAITDLPGLRDVLDGRPRALLCGACGDVLPVSARIEIEGVGWSAALELDGTGRPPHTPHPLVESLSAHLHGVIGAVWKAPDRSQESAIVLKRFDEFTSEAMAAAILAAEGRLPGWVVGEGEDPSAVVDATLGPAQSAALVAAALAAAGEDSVVLAELLGSHIAPGLILPRAAVDLTHSVSSLLQRGEHDITTSVCLLAMHAAAQLAAARPDSLAREFTRVWLSWAWQADQVPEDQSLQRLALPAGLLHKAVDASILTEAVMQTTDSPPDWIERLQRIAEMAGHPRLIRQVVRQAPVMLEASSDVFRDALSALARDGSTQALTEGLRCVLSALRASGREDELESMTDHALALSDGSDVARAALLTQFGSATKDARMPAAFLQKVGDTPADWEAALPDPLRLAISTERYAALRIAGRFTDAQHVLRPALDIPLDEENRWRLELNLAIVERDTGASDSALVAVEQLLSRAPDDDCRFLALQSLARSTSELGMHAETIEHLQAAIPLALGEHAHHEPTLRAHLASLLAAAGDVEGALAQLKHVTAAGSPMQARLGAADAIVVLLERGVEFTADGLDATRDHLNAVEALARQNGDRVTLTSALRIRARMDELLGNLDTAATSWEELLSLTSDPLALASLATLRGAGGRVDEARALMSQIPEALIREHGGASDIGAVLDTTARIRGALRRLSSVMMSGRPAPRDVRMAAELSRDAIGRMRAWSTATDTPPSRQALADGLPDEALRRIAPETSALWVLEWWEGEQGVVSLLSCVRRSQELTFQALPTMPLDARDVAIEVRTQLSNWWPGRLGDPLAHAGWHALADWLRAALASAVDGDHLIVIEHPQLAGLPWHAIDDAPWTTSYAPSWSALLDLPAKRPLNRCGLVSVPARNDRAGTVQAFDSAEKDARFEAQARGLRLDVTAGVEADSEAVLSLFGRCDLATILCHGLIDPSQRELALLVAADAQLPSQHPAAASSARGRAHRLTWRALQGVERGPEIVLSGACSTGQGVYGGMGERLGLFGALRAKGTRAVVAPAWDAVASDMPDQLSELSSLLLDGASLAGAVKAIGDQRAGELPIWRARILCLEGDWR